MEHTIKSDERITENSSLLMLNDDCLMKIYLYLELFDYVNLANTCCRLRDVADSVRVNKFTDVSVEIRDGLGGNGSIGNKILSYEDFGDMLPVFGRQLQSIKIFNGNDLILKTISDNCKNINSMNLTYFYGSFELQNFNFKNLKELKISSCDIEIKYLKSYFESNPNIESLQYHDDEVSDTALELLQLLPNLKSLDIHLSSNQQLQHLLNLHGLTKLSFHSRNNCNHILIQLAAYLNLVELDITMDIDDFTFDIIKSFKGLEVLSISPAVDCWLSSWYWRFLPEATIFPLKLKYIKLDAISMSCTTFLSIVKQLKFLEEFDLGFADIFRDFEREISCDLPSDELILLAKIVDELTLTLKQRSLKVVFPDCRLKNMRHPAMNTLPYLYNSDHLNIIRRRYSMEPQQSNKTIIKISCCYHDESVHDSSFSSLSD